MTALQLRICRWIIIFFCVFFASGSALAGTYDNAIAAFKQNDFAMAIRLLLPLAEQGNSDAQHVLGNAYFWRQEYQNTAKWYRRSANQGDTKAQQDLGHMYLKGQGVPRDYVEAYKWFALAAANERDQPWQHWAGEELNDLDRLMTRVQIAEAQRLAKEWNPSTKP
jgi:TPR repeat protein